MAFCIAARGDFGNHLPDGNDEIKLIIKLSKSFLERATAKTEADRCLELKLQC
jgi:hypothetical protein